jgi:hypothetical protein
MVTVVMLRALIAVRGTCARAGGSVSREFVTFVEAVGAFVPGSSEFRD